MRPPGLCVLSLLLVMSSSAASAQQRVDVGPFSSGSLANWQHESFVGETVYRLVQSAGNTVLQADSHQSASVLYFPVKIDLQKTPLLNWSWRKNSTLNPGDESTKSGDDYVARVYVVFKGGLLFWKTRAINYVWSFQHRRGQVWDNPFAGAGAKMISQRDDSHAEERWFSEQRDVAADFRELFGEDVRFIDAVAVMTDSDNSVSSASAMYGDIYFSSRTADVTR